MVTIDVMGCQESFAEKIVAKKADYILAVKQNHGSLLDGVMDSFQMLAVDAVEEAIRVTGATLLYLPPYSPDFNLIEKFFSKLKALLRKAPKDPSTTDGRKSATCSTSTPRQPATNGSEHHANVCLLHATLIPSSGASPEKR